MERTPIFFNKLAQIVIYGDPYFFSFEFLPQVLNMGNQLGWTAKLAFVRYLAVAGGTLVSVLLVQVIFSFLKVGAPSLSFPIVILSLPVNEVVILAVTLTFARHKGAGLRELGLKTASVKVLIVASLAALPLFARALFSTRT